MRKQFKREQRYFVVKVKDAKEYLDAHQLEKLAEIADTISEGREKDGIPAVESVVVESDWPEYESTWRAIEDRVTGAQPAPSIPAGWKLVPIEPTPSVPTALLVAAADLVAQMEIISRVGFVDTPNDKDSCAAFCIAEGTWLELVSAIESLAAALAAAPEVKP